ncbi:MAG TPA: HEAT repeat domain-containing protein, partial [Gammaproteobacteria bacterium]|nr:HEAT repeat domain-containing protein [Gammaproteobacteria bacterium]
TLTEYVSGSLTANHPFQVQALTLCMRLKFYHITLPPEGLILSPADLIKTYRQAPQKWVNLIKSCPKVSIQFQTPIPFSHPLILYYALSEPEGPLLVEALLASGVPANQVRSEDGLTPLHFAASFYPNCIPALIAGGAQTECTNAEGLTPLDLSMHSNQYKAVILLLQGGAGRNLKAPLGLAFIKAYQKLCPELCQSLLSRNIAMAWYSALETISQESPTQEVVASMGGVQNKRYLRLEIYRDIFKKGSIFPKDNIHGVRSVTAIQCKIAEGIHVGLHLKKDPELPGREIMVHVLAKHLFGFITPSIALWRFTKKTLLKKEVAYPVLASRSIKGKNLLEVLKKNPEQLKKLDKQSAYQAIILAMMINPEDGRPDNYIMEPFSKGSEIAYRLVSIDNDHAFVRPIALKKSGAELTGTKALQVKTILYCLEEMQDALPSEMVNQLLTNNPYELLRGWLIELQQQQQEIDELFNEKEKKELLKQDIHLNILFKFSVIEDVYQKLCRLQTVLRESPKTPLLRILRVVIPELWIRYAGIFSQYPTPLERFNVLAKDAFDTRVITIEGERHLYLESTAKASQVIQMTGSLRDEEKALKEEKEDTSGTALLRLDKLYAECSAIAEIAAELQKGKVDRFKKLPSIHQEKIVNGDGTLPGIDFNTMLVAGNPDIKRQQTVLSALRDVSFRVLKIRNLTVLTDKQLSAFLQENKGLLALNLEGCSGLTDAAARIIEDNCPNLEKLFINKLSWSQVSLSLPHLRVLYVQECGKLRSWEIKAPSKIDRLYFKNCQLLCNLGVYSTELRELELQNCPKLPENQLLKLAANTTFLKKVELAACLAISNANFYRKYPKLLNFSLQDFSNEFVERLDAGMAIILKEVGMSAAMIQPLMIEKLQENVILWQRFKRTLFFPALLKVLEDKDPEVRNCVCETLSKLPLTAEDREIVLPALLKTLEDTDSDVRNCAVQALSNLLLLTVKDINTVLPLLLKALRDKSRAFKNGVCEALSKLPLTGNDMATVLPVLLNLLENEYADVRISAAQAFSTLPLRPENIATVWPVFLKTLADENEKVRSHVCNALSKLPLTDEDFTVVLAALLKQLVDKNRTIRSGACEALSKLPLAAKNIATVLPPLLIMALDDEHAEVRSHACEALSNLSLMAVDAARVLPVLLKALADAEADVRGHACEALSKLALSTKDQITVVSALTKVVEDEDEYEYVSASAAQALSTLSLKAEDVAAVTPDLKALGDVKSSAEVVQSRLSLATSDEKIKQLPELLKALEDENGTVSSKSAAAQALLKLPLTVEDKILVVLPTLLMSLENPSFETRTQMLGLLVIFYPLMQEMVEACCQKFKKATRPPIVTQSAPAESTHQKEGLLSVHIHSSHQQMNVSGQGNNCGLFALILGIKKGLEHKPQLRNATRLPEFFDAIDIAWLRPDTEAKETGEVGMKLRQAMADTLLKDAQYKARRYHNVVAACREFLEGEPSALDMQAWLAVTRGYREPLKQEWREISDVLEKSYNTVEADYRQLLSNNPLNLDYIGQLKEQLCKQVMDKPQSKVLNALLDAYYPTESHSMLGLIKLRCLYRAAWLGVTVSTGLERNGVSDCMEKLFKKKILTILQQQGVSESPENLLLFSLLEKTNFDQSGILVGNGIAAREEVLSTAAALFVENDLVHHWDFLYQNYCVHIKTTPAMLSADELGCLARCWNIRLKIQFAYGEPYKTEEMIDSEQLQVTLCNPSQMHWNVVCESGAHFDMRWNSSTIVMLILGIENIEYRTYITDAINNEIAYAKRSEDCSYVVGVVSAIQETPYVLLQQGVSLSAADFNAAKGLSQYFEEGFLRLNAEQIYFLKGLLSKNIFESSAVVSVAKWVDELSLTENR